MRQETMSNPAGADTVAKTTSRRPAKTTQQPTEQAQAPASTAPTTSAATKPASRPAKTSKHETGSTASSSASATGRIILTMLLVDAVRPSGWNPNQMSGEDFEAYRAEVRLLGKPPKPIVVIREGDGYIIVDGEHAWRAAKDVGLKEVPCEILEVDLFEAMRQTAMRNCHGENDPVRLGRLYDRMLKARNLSNRALAAKLRITEGSIRNQLKYAEAADMRKHYAPDDADERISKLTVEQVRAYLELPAGQQNEWLDSGAKMDAAAKLKKENAEPAKPETTAPVEDAAPAAETTNGSTTAKAGRTTDKPNPAKAPASDAPAPTQEAETNDTSEVKEPFQQDVLDELESSWNRANAATRKKFLAGVFAEPNTLALVRRLIKQGS